jgi:hypothetical protein
MPTNDRIRRASLAREPVFDGSVNGQTGRSAFAAFQKFFRPAEYQIQADSDVAASQWIIDTVDRSTWLSKRPDQSHQ